MSRAARAHNRRLRRRPEPVVGWRAWRVARDGGELRLESVVHDVAWPPGSPLTARCPAHAAPAVACTCGIYAARSPAVALRYLVGRNDPDVVHRVIGTAELWGVVVQGEHGWRAEHAYPARLFLPRAWTSGVPVDAPAISATLAEAYAVPVEEIAESEPDALSARFST